MAPSTPPAHRSRTALVATLLAVVALAASLAIVPLAARPASATPWTGAPPGPTDLVVYFHNASTPVTVGAASYLLVMSTVNDTSAPWNGSGANSVAAHYDAVSFVAAPQLARPLVLNGSVAADVYLNQSGSSLTGGSVTLSVSAVSPNGSLTLLGTGTAVGTGAIGAGESIPSLVALPGPSLHTTVPAGDSLAVNVTITGTSSTHYGIWWGSVNGTVYASQVDLPASSYLTVGNVSVRNATGAPVSSVAQSGGNETLTVSGNVSDPLGAYDFLSSPVDLLVLNATLAVALGPAPMAAVPSNVSAGAANATFVGAFNYSGLAPGTYTVVVRASDLTDAHTGTQNTLPTYFGRVASGNATLVVGLPPVPLTTQVLDNRSVALPGAVVRAFSGAVLLATNRTNASGDAGFLLPNGSAYTFRVSWEGVAVGSIPEVVDAPNLTFALTVNVFYPTFSFVTAADGAPLSYALVTIVHPNGTTLPLAVASAAGTVPLAQVPQGTYTLTVIYDDSEVVAARAVAVGSDGTISVVVQGVYSLSVATVTSSGAPLDGVAVTVINATTGATIASGISHGSSPLVFLVPAGVYEVNGTWSTTFDLTALSESSTTVVSVTSPSVATLSFGKAFPAFTSTNEFYLVLGYVALAVVVAALLLMLRRKGKKGVPPLTPAPPIAAAEDAESPAPAPKGGHR